MRRTESRGDRVSRSHYRLPAIAGQPCSLLPTLFLLSSRGLLSRLILILSSSSPL
ncbi:hypothetical protein C4D60_Mb02t08140 [Musa balbisiana]|uniref:Uncharacterized protein n=1 Tax=Musa balbisiana TaxID=52838 RepID=A0A4S8I940_MUSBA|nr:hypothetical protein C4D60_Mb02t08140 [Musa balbisiana]